MTVETKVKVAGAWKLLTEPKVKVGGAWKAVQQIQVKVGGAWKTAFEIVGGTVPLVSDIEIIHTVSSGNANAGIHFNYPTGGVDTEDARVLTRRHGAGFQDMGNDDASPPVDHTGEWTTDTITPSEWEVAWITTISGSWTLVHAAIGVYSLLSTLGSASSMRWTVRRLGGKGYSPGTSAVRAVFRIREVADTSNFDDFEVICTAIQT